MAYKRNDLFLAILKYVPLVEHYTTLLKIVVFCYPSISTLGRRVNFVLDRVVNISRSIGRAFLNICIWTVWDAQTDFPPPLGLGVIRGELAVTSLVWTSVTRLSV